MNQKILDSLSPILITGPTGVGKTRRAREIHLQSKRKNEPFIHVNVAAIPESLFCAEMFGSEKGAFTGATNQKNGFCSQAGAGTLFLDEIGELPKHLQAALLTLVEQRSFYRIGGQNSLELKARIILATNKDLDKSIKQGEFREDLYFRIRFFHIKLKALSFMHADLTPLIIEYINQKKVEHSRFDIRFSSEVMSALANYKWPGNYREFFQCLDYIFLLDTNYIEVKHLPYWIRGEDQQDKYLETTNFKQALESFEKNYICTQLHKNKGKLNQTSLSSGINKVTLISKLKKYGIDRTQYNTYHTA